MFTVCSPHSWAGGGAGAPRPRPRLRAARRAPGGTARFVAERLVEHISNFQTKVQNITDEEIYQLLEEGEKYANQVANQKLLEVQKAVGLR